VPRLKEGRDGVLWQVRVTEAAHVCSSSYHLACLSDRKERPCALSQVDHEISWLSVAMDCRVPASPLRHGSSRLPADANKSSGPGTWPHLAPIPCPANLEPKLRVSCSALLSLSLCAVHARLIKSGVVNLPPAHTSPLVCPKLLSPNPTVAPVQARPQPVLLPLLSSFASEPVPTP